MKKILIVTIMLLTAATSFSQRRGSAPNWLTIAVKGGYGNSIMFSKAISDNKDLKYDYMAPSYCFGGRLGVVFADVIGVSAEFLGSGFNQQYTYNNGKVNIDGKIKYTSTDFLALLRYTGQYGLYCEIGPKFTFIKSAEREFDNITTDVADQYVDKFTSFAFGIGFMPYNGDRVQVSLGVRAAYCSKNVLNTQDNPYGTGSLLTIENTELKPFSAQIMLEANYMFARFGRASCGKGKIIFFD